MIFLLSDTIDIDYLTRRLFDDGGNIDLLNISSPKS